MSEWVSERLSGKKWAKIRVFVIIAHFYTDVTPKMDRNFITHFFDFKSKKWVILDLHVPKSYNYHHFDDFLSHLSNKRIFERRWWCFCWSFIDTLQAMETWIANKYNKIMFTLTTYNDFRTISGPSIVKTTQTSTISTSTNRGCYRLNASGSLRKPR